MRLLLGTTMASEKLKLLNQGIVNLCRQVYRIEMSTDDEGALQEIVKEAALMVHVRATTLLDEVDSGRCTPTSATSAPRQIPPTPGPAVRRRLFET